MNIVSPIQLQETISDELKNLLQEKVDSFEI